MNAPSIWRSIRDRCMRKKRKVIDDAIFGKPVNDWWMVCATAGEKIRAEYEKDQISMSLRAEVYIEPTRYDRPKILAMLDQVVSEYPDDAPAVLHDAFSRVVEESSTDTDTWVIDQFLAHGASATWVWCLFKAVQPLEINNNPIIRCQVVSVLRRLIQAGADPDVAWPELEGLSVSESWARDPRRVWCLDALNEVMDPIRLNAQLEINTAPAPAPSRPARRL